MLTGDRLEDEELEEILKFTHTEEDLDGNIKYGGKAINNNKNNKKITKVVKNNKNNKNDKE